MSAGRRAILGAALLAGIASCDRRTEVRNDPPPVMQTADSGPVSVLLTLDRNKLTTADHVRLTITATARDAAAVALPEPPADLGGFTVVERATAAPSLDTDGGLTLSESWVLEPFLPGEYTVPPLEVVYTPAHGKSGVIRTEPVKIEVASVLAADEQDKAEIGEARDVVDPATPAAATPGYWLAGGAVALASLLAGGGAWWAFGRRPATPPNPYLAAERRIRALQDGAMADPPAAVAETSSLIRACLADRLEPLAQRRTTDELLSSPAVSLNFNEQDLEALGRGLRAADVAKFGGGRIGEEQARVMMTDTLGLVRVLADMAVVKPAAHNFHNGSGLHAEGAAA